MDLDTPQYIAKTIPSLSLAGKHIPPGFFEMVNVKVFFNPETSQVVIEGTPAEEEVDIAIGPENEAILTTHAISSLANHSCDGMSCDGMSCGQAHVVIRAEVTHVGL